MRISGSSPLGRRSTRTPKHLPNPRKAGRGVTQSRGRITYHYPKGRKVTVRRRFPSSGGVNPAGVPGTRQYAQAAQLANLRRAALRAITSGPHLSFFNPADVQSIGKPHAAGFGLSRAELAKLSGGTLPFQSQLKFRSGTPEAQYQQAFHAAAKQRRVQKAKQHRSLIDKIGNFGEGVAKSAFDALPPVVAFHVARAIASGHPEKIPGIAANQVLDVGGYHQIAPLIAAEKGVTQKTLAPTLHGLAKQLKTGKGGRLGVATPVGKVQLGKGPSKILVNAAKDAINLPAEVVPSAALMIQHPGETIKSFPKTDPIGRLLFHGDTGGITQHPLNAALELSGARAVAGRGLGSVARGVDRVAGTHVGSTTRAPLKLYESAAGGPVIPRSYSRDLIGKAGQVALERAKRRHGRDPNAAAHNLIAPRRRQAYQLGKRVDDLAHQSNAVRTADRVRVRRAVNDALKPVPKQHHPAVALAVEKVLRGPRTVFADLHAHRAKLLKGAQNANLTHEQARLHHEYVAQIDSLLKDKALHANPTKVFHAAEKLIAQSNDLTRQLQDRGLLTAERANAKLIPYAVTHMDALPSTKFHTGPRSGRKTDPYFLQDRHGNEITPEMVKAHMQGDTRLARRLGAKSAQRIQVFDPVATAKALARRARKGQPRPEIPKVNVAGMKVWGHADTPAHRVMWFHGTSRKYEGLPSSKGRWSDLGVYLTSDPTYARQYAHDFGSAHAGRVLGVHVNPRRVFDLRAGRMRAGDALALIGQLRKQAPVAAAGVVKMSGHVGHHGQLVERTARQNFERALGGLERSVRAQRLTTPQAMADFQNSLQALSERMGEGFGLIGTGNRHQVLQQAFRNAGFDAIRKVDAGADALVVLDEGLLKRSTPVVSKSLMSRAAATKPVGRAVTALQARTRANGVTEPGFFSQKTGGRNPYYRPLADQGFSRPTLSAGKRRGGTSSALGLHEIGGKVLEESAARSMGDVSQAMSFDEAMSELGMHKPHVQTQGGKPVVVGKRYFRSWDEAYRAAHELAGKNGIEFVPVKVGRLTQVHDLISAADPSADTLTHVSEAIMDAFRQDPGHRGQYLVAPAAVRDRFLQHLQPRGPLQKRLSKFAQVWSRSVLSGSTKWLFGNAGDISIRSAAEGLTPVDFVRGIKVARDLKRLDPRAYEKVKASTLGGTMYSATEQAGTYHPPTRFTQAPPGSGLTGKVVAAPGKAIKTAWNGWTDMWFGPEQAIERLPQYAALGKVARRDTQRTLTSVRGFLKVGGPAFEDFVHGLTETPNQIKAQRYAEQVFGRWGKNSPAGRAFLIQYAPFAQWLRVAGKFVYYTLPTHHPIKTGMLASINAMTEQERKKLGLDLFAGDSALADFLQGSIPTKKGMIRAQGYTSAGIMSQFPSSLSNVLIPELSTGLKAFQGIDWQNNKLVLANGKQPDAAQRALLGLYIIGEGMVPLAGIARRLRESGGKPYAESTIFAPKVQPGTKKSGGATLGKVFNPIAVVGHTSPLDTKINALYKRHAALDNQLKPLKSGLRRDSRGYFVYTGRAKQIHDAMQRLQKQIGALRVQRKDPYIPPSQRKPRVRRHSSGGIGGGLSGGLGGGLSGGLSGP